MLPDPNQPLLRTQNYLTDVPFWHKRWIRTQWSQDTVGSVILPADATTFPKSIDPNWRTSWKQTLLGKPGLFVPFRPVIMVNGKAWTTIFSIRTKLFSVRLGPDVARIVLYTGAMEWLEPECYGSSDGLEPVVLDQAAMRSHISSKQLAVTAV